MDSDGGSPEESPEVTTRNRDRDPPGRGLRATGLETAISAARDRSDSDILDTESSISSFGLRVRVTLVEVL